MNGMILAAGLGTRMLPVSRICPKPLLPLLGKTLLDIRIESVRNAGAEKIVVNMSHLADRMEAYLSGKDYGVEVVPLRERKILGTAGGIKNAQRWLDRDDFIVMNSDLLFDPEPDFGVMIESHRRNDAVSTLLLKENPDPEKYSSLALMSGKISLFPGATGPNHDPGSKNLMFTGVSILSPEIFKIIPAGRPVDISTEIYAPMVQNNGPIYGVVTNSGWTDLGTLSDYRKAVIEQLNLSTPAPATIWAELQGYCAINPVYIEAGAKVEKEAIIGPNAIIMAGATVGKGARVEESVLLTGSILEEGESCFEEVLCSEDGLRKT